MGSTPACQALPLWGTDIGGFYGTTDFTGELFVRWFQFAAFCPLFRSHGRNWHLHLPWGWDEGDGGPNETQGFRADPAELHNKAVEPICRKYLELTVPGCCPISTRGRARGARHGHANRIARDVAALPGRCRRNRTRN